MAHCESLVRAFVSCVLLASALEAAEGSALAAVRDRGELVVLTWPHQESIFTRRMVTELGRDGLNVIGGVDIDVMRLYADHLGVELRVQAVKPAFSALIPSLLAGHGDVIASSMTITRGRSRQVDFSVPYFEVNKVVVVPKGSSIASVADLAGKSVSVVPGTSHEEQIRSSFPDLEIRPVQFMLENYQSVADAAADFTVVDSSSAARVLGEFPDLGEELSVAFEFPESDHFGFAVAKGSDLKESLDEFVETILKDGRLAQILDKHKAPRKSSIDLLAAAEELASAEER